MQIQLGAKVRTSDGHRAGEIKKVVWDPDTNEVRDFLVSTGAILGHDVLISREALEKASKDGDEVVIDLSAKELDDLEHYDDAAFTPPPYEWVLPASYAFPIAAVLFPTEPMAVPLRSPKAPEREERAARSPKIVKGMKVKDASGETLGVVKELRVDDQTGELRSIVVEERNPLGLSTARTTELPADHVDIGDGELHVIEDTRGTHVPKRDGI